MAAAAFIKRLFPKKYVECKDVCSDPEDKATCTRKCEDIDAPLEKDEKAPFDTPTRVLIFGGVGFGVLLIIVLLFVVIRSSGISGGGGG